MADKQQLARLKEGVASWNAWRRKNSEIIIALSGAKLVKSHLSEADLTGADLTGADFTGADLSGADLRWSDLRFAKLSGASLRGAQCSLANLEMAFLTHSDLFRARLDKANLSLADLSEADLSEADLIETNLRGAELSGANLSRADLTLANLNMAYLDDAEVNGVLMGSTSIADVDLRQVKGLETIRHDGPSMVGIDTAYMSQGNIPEIFLRGCGVPENFITYIRSLTGKAFEYYSCFISYSSKDKHFANRIHADLQQMGVRCWFAPENLKTGEEIRKGIDEAIRVYDKLVLILSKDSIKSTWVEKEVETAFEKEQTRKKTVLFPVRIDDAVMKSRQPWAADIRRTRHIGDMSNWKDHDSYQKAFERLLRDLQAASAKS